MIGIRLRNNQKKKGSCYFHDHVTLSFTGIVERICMFHHTFRTSLQKPKTIDETH